MVSRSGEKAGTGRKVWWVLGLVGVVTFGDRVGP